MTTSFTDPKTNPGSPSRVPGPPTKHQMALMIWLAVFPTLTVLNLALGDWLRPLNPILRTFVLATIAVPIISLCPDATAPPAPQKPPDPHRRSLIRHPIRPCGVRHLQALADPVKPTTENR